MLIKPTEYNGESVIKLSAIVKTASDLLAVIHDITADEALLVDLGVVEADLKDLFDSLTIMELPGVYRGIHNEPPDEPA